MLPDKPVNSSEWRALIGASGVGTKVQGAEGFSLEFQEKMTDSLHRDLSSDKNMSWVRRDSWLTYLTLNAPDDKVTYDMSVTPMGVVRVAPFGTKPMAIVDGNAIATQPLDDGGPVRCCCGTAGRPPSSRSRSPGWRGPRRERPPRPRLPPVCRSGRAACRTR